MRILFATCSPRGYMAPPSLSDEQVNCGPDWSDDEIGGHFLSLRTGVGDYDLAAIAARLPDDQQPDVVVCLVDASWRSRPRNLAAFRCPKVLLVADTHHLKRPLTGMIEYAQSEPYDRVVMLYGRHHYTFLQDAAVGPLYWFPGLTFPHSDAVVAAARQPEREKQIAFVGQTGFYHPRRLQALSAISARGVPLAMKAVAQHEGLRHYGRSLAAFNASLNGDLNLRILETLAAGAALLTDRLSPEAGLERLWTPKQQLVTYGDSKELADLARYLVDHPSEAAAIGAAGAQWFDTHFNQEARRRAFADLAFDGKAHPLFDLPAPAHRSRPSPASLARHLHLTSAFEYVQELHRSLETVHVAVADEVPAEFAQMCQALPRLRLTTGFPPKGTIVDFLAVSHRQVQPPILMSAKSIWCWDASTASEAERTAVARRVAGLGFAPAEADVLVFTRRQLSSHNNFGARALALLDQGESGRAVEFARTELVKNPKSIDALLVMAEAATEAGNDAVRRSVLAQLRILAPHHPRLRELESASAASLREQRLSGMLRQAARLVEVGLANQAVTLANEVLEKHKQSAGAYHVLALAVQQRGERTQALSLFRQAAQLAPTTAEYWHDLGREWRRADLLADALAALVYAATLKPGAVETQFALAETALAIGHGAIAVEALQQVLAQRPALQKAQLWLARAEQLAAQAANEPPRDLLLSHVEVTRLQGTGVLLQRFFQDASEFITVRSRTLYGGRVDFGGLHFALDLPGVPATARRELLRRLLAPYRIRRILCVPFFATDFVHALLAKELTGAPLCTYVMDDQTVHSREVPAELAQKVFDASDLRLAISPEMIADYSPRFRQSFGLLPPIVATLEHQVPNHWEATPASPPTRGVMVGNIWSRQQFEQLRTFVRGAAISIDWFGNADVSWLPKDKDAIAQDGIHCRGFLAEDDLAARLATYPFVLIPSGTLDGSEDNEWLTRMSLPSRMVFIVTKTFTPMLVLGSPETAAARFVRHFDLGTSSNYDPTEALGKIREFSSPDRREQLLANARRAAACFLMPDCGDWIWRSLEARQPLSTPFDDAWAPAASSSSTACNPILAA